MSVQKTVDRYKVWQITESCPEAAICDRGYRGRKKVGDTSVLIPGRPKKSDTPYQRRKAWQRFRRRAGIKPVIGHLKHDYRMARNYLKGTIGDATNLFMACAAYNFRKWMRELWHHLSLFAAWLCFGIWGRCRLRQT
jgi:IS5 family transposase